MSVPEGAYQESVAQPAQSGMGLIVVDRIFAFLQTCAKWGFGAWVAVKFTEDLRLSIGYLAGQDTHADLMLSYFVSSPSGLTVSVSVTVGVSGLGYGLLERTLRHRTLARYRNRNAELERRLDPDRTSSGLTADGRTHPRDK